MRPISPRALRLCLGMGMALRPPWSRVLQGHLITQKLGPTWAGPVLPHPAMDQDYPWGGKGEGEGRKGASVCS